MINGNRPSTSAFWPLHSLPNMLPTLSRNPLSPYQECAPGIWCLQLFFKWIGIITHVPFVIFCFISVKVAFYN